MPVLAEVEVEVGVVTFGVAWSFTSFAFEPGRVAANNIPVRDIFSGSEHPYTRSLLEAIPALSNR